MRVGEPFVSPFSRMEILFLVLLRVLILGIITHSISKIRTRTHYMPQVAIIAPTRLSSQVITSRALHPHLLLAHQLESGIFSNTLHGRRYGDKSHCTQRTTQLISGVFCVFIFCGWSCAETHEVGSDRRIRIFVLSDAYIYVIVHGM